MLPLSTLTGLPTLAHVLEAAARDEPGRLIAVDETGHLTLSAVAEEAKTIAAALAASGVQRGDRVVVILPAGLDFIRLFWGVQRAGAVVCALNPYAPPAASIRRAKDARPRLVIAEAENAVALETAGVPSFTLGELGRAAGPCPALGGGRDDLAWLQPTSGTSGEPRLAMILQRNAIDMAQSMFSVDWSDHIGPHVAWVPPWHDLGLVRFVVGPAFNGATVHIIQPSVYTIPKWLETVARTGAPVTGAPDFAWRIATHAVSRDLDLSPLKYALSGGEPVRIATVRAFEERFGIPGAMHAGYGLAEATLAVAFQRPGSPLVVDERGTVSCGLPSPGVEVRVDGSDGSGEILVRGANVFPGYFGEPEATAEVLRDGWLHTGDIGRIDAKGHLYVLGRKRVMLKRGGAMLAPREVEDAALKVEGVRLAAAIGLAPEGARATESLVLAVELLKNSAVEPQSIASRIATSVRDEVGFAPDRLLVLGPRSIPLTWNGKIRHAALREDVEKDAFERRGVVLFDSDGVGGV